MALQQKGGACVAPYANGEAFAAKYGQMRFISMCQGVQVTRSGAREPRYPAPAPAFAHTTGGDANFTRTVNGQPMAGFAYAETMLVSFGQAGNWYVVGLASFLCPAAQADATRALLKHSADSIVFNPEWLAMQAKIISRATHVNQQTAQGNMKAIEETNARMRQWSKNMAGQTAGFNDVLLGVTLTRDPATGAIQEVPTGAGGPKWKDGQGHIVDSAMAPGEGFHPLTTINNGDVCHN